MSEPQAEPVVPDEDADVERAANEDADVERTPDDELAEDVPPAIEEESDALAEPEQAPEPESKGLTPEEWDEHLDKIAKRFATYTRAVGDILAEQATDLLPCPLCLGQVPGFVNRQAAGRVDPEQADLVKHFLGLARPVELKPLPGYRACESCGGEGKGYTGSHNPEHATITCLDCHGRGYKSDAAVAPPNGNGVPPVTLPATSLPGTDLSQGDTDEWNQPKLLPDGRDNPNYGRAPSYWIQVPPWGDTRGLTAQDVVPA